jgi:hypothetical protein
MGHDSQCAGCIAVGGNSVVLVVQGVCHCRSGSDRGIYLLQCDTAFRDAS